ncbi:hypothetical protein V7968_22580 [Nocardia vulneris]|uniref:hypothetical protein n=1 Tax=Nocardia vulneris TaxID=1141657 RepID=UPI0030D416C6
MSIDRHSTERRTVTRGGVVALLSALTLAAPTLAAAREPAPDATITCDDHVTSEESFYNGPRASDTYDKHFAGSHTVPDLDTHVPQGLATWSRWNGTDDLLLITAYAPKSQNDAYIIGLDAKTGRRVGAARIDATHAGGIAVFEQQGWAYVSGSQGKRVRKYPLGRLREAISTSAHLAQVGDDIVVDGGSSFLGKHGDSLWTGQFETDTRGAMYSYRVGPNGELTGREGPWEVPEKTQGLAVTDDLFLYSTSYGRPNRSNIYVVRRGAGDRTLDTARLSCFRAPSMSEGMSVYGGAAYVVYESGAAYYRSDPKNKPRNIIEHLHRGALAQLGELPPQ